MYKRYVWEFFTFRAHVYIISETWSIGPQALREPEIKLSPPKINFGEDQRVFCPSSVSFFNFLWNPMKYLRKQSDNSEASICDVLL